MMFLSIGFSSCCKGTWSNWTPTERKCESNFWCVFKSQKATYQYYEKIKECENRKGSLRHEKRSKIKCGC